MARAHQALLVRILDASLSIAEATDHVLLAGNLLPSSSLVNCAGAGRWRNSSSADSGYWSASSG